jgi:hypothetical protein
MGRRGFKFLVIGLSGTIWAISGFAGQLTVLPKDPEAPWTMVSPPFSRAPAENGGTELLNAPVPVVSVRARVAIVRSPTDARRARMAAARMHLRLPHAADVLYYPEPVQLPSDIKSLSQAF